MRANVLLLAGFITLTVAGLWISQPSSPPLRSSPKNQPEIRIGAVLALTGSAAQWGDFSLKGARLAIEDLNKEQERSGQTFVLEVEDSASRPAQAVAAYYKITANDHPSAILGDVWAMLTNPLVPLAERDRLLLVSPTVVDSSVTYHSANFFTLGARIALVRGATERFFDGHPNIKRAAIFGWQDPWGESYTALWKEVLRERHISLVAEFLTNDFSHDYRAEVSRALGAGADCFIVAEGHAEILRLLREQQRAISVLSTSGIVTARAQGLIPASLLTDVHFTDWPPTENFARRFKATFGVDPQFEAFRSYEAVHAIAGALEQSAMSPAEAMRRVAFDGVGGRVDFRDGIAGSQSEAKTLHLSRRAD